VGYKNVPLIFTYDCISLPIFIILAALQSNRYL